MSVQAAEIKKGGKFAPVLERVRRGFSRDGFEGAKGRDRTRGGICKCPTGADIDRMVTGVMEIFTARHRT